MAEAAALVWLAFLESVEAHLAAEAAGAVVPVALTTLDTIFTMAAEEVALGEVAL